MKRIVIIGGGIIGSMIAYELSLIADYHITLLEAKTPASGSTGAALGVLMGIISHKTKGRAWQLRELSVKRYQTLIPELEAKTGISILHNTQGIVLLQPKAFDRLSWEKLQQTRATQGYPLEIWDQDTLQQHCPTLDTYGLDGAIYSPHDQQVHPRDLTIALLKGANLQGVNVQLGVEVHHIELTPLNGDNLQQCSNVYTSEGVFSADYLILCTGIGTTPLLQCLTSKPISVQPVLGQALEIQLSHSLGHCSFQPVITGDDVHIVPLDNHRYWVGATVEFPDELGNCVPNNDLLEQVKQQAFQFFPELAQGEVISQWQGKRPRPEGMSAPVIQFLQGYSNVILATGHYRNGILLAPATALKVRDLLA